MKADRSFPGDLQRRGGGRGFPPESALNKPPLIGVHPGLPPTFRPSYSDKRMMGYPPGEGSFHPKGDMFGGPPPGPGFYPGNVCITVDFAPQSVLLTYLFIYLFFVAGFDRRPDVASSTGARPEASRDPRKKAAANSSAAGAPQPVPPVTSTSQGSDVDEGWQS